MPESSAGVASDLPPIATRELNTRLPSMDLASFAQFLTQPDGAAIVGGSSVSQAEVQTRSGRISRPPQAPERGGQGGPSNASNNAGSAPSPTADGANDTAASGDEHTPGRPGRPHLPAEERRQRQRERNRQAAMQHRQRKKEKMDDMQRQLDDKCDAYDALQKRCLMLERNVRLLTDHLQSHGISLPPGLEEPVESDDDDEGPVDVSLPPDVLETRIRKQVEKEVKRRVRELDRHAPAPMPSASPANIAPTQVAPLAQVRPPPPATQPALAPRHAGPVQPLPPITQPSAPATAPSQPPLVPPVAMQPDFALDAPSSRWWAPAVSSVRDTPFTPYSNLNATPGAAQPLNDIPILPFDFDLSAIPDIPLPDWDSFSAFFHLDEMEDEAEDADFVPPTSPKEEDGPARKRRRTDTFEPETPGTFLEDTSPASSPSDEGESDDEASDEEAHGEADEEEEDLFLPIEDVPVPPRARPRASVDTLYADAMAALGVSTRQELAGVVGKIVETANRGGVTAEQVEGLRRLIRLAEAQGMYHSAERE